VNPPVVDEATREEVFARIAELPPIELDPPAAAILRDERRRH